MFVRETREDTCLRLRIQVRKYNSSSAIAHFTSSVLSRADYIRHTKQTFTIAPLSEFTCLFELFFPFFHFPFLHSETFHTGYICAHCYAEIFFNREYTNWGSTPTFLVAPRIFIALRFLISFSFLMTMNFYYRLNFREKSGKGKIYRR